MTAYKFECLGVFFLAEDIGAQCVGYLKKKAAFRFYCCFI